MLCDRHVQTHTLPSSQKHIARSLRRSRTHQRKSSCTRCRNVRSDSAATKKYNQKLCYCHGYLCKML